MLDAQGLGDFIDAQYCADGDRLFRMEQLSVYNVPHQSADLEAWLVGGEPNWAAKREWWDVLAADHARGQRQSRVRVFSEHLTDDELMSCHWGYPHTGRWENIRVLRRGEHHLPDGLLGQDYWLIGDDLVLLMHYSGPGAFIGAEVLPPGEVARFVRDREAAWDAAEPFTAWWARHGELHRQLVP